MSGEFGFHSTAEDVTEGLDLSGRTYVVTGCNSGLGAETARVLALRGARVIGTARTLEKAREALAGIDGVPVACELADLHSVAAAVERIRAEGPLDGIIANAGVMAIHEHLKTHGIERQLFTNHVGHFVFVTGLLDALTDDGRVVILSSGAHRMAPDAGIELDNLAGESYDPWKAYGQSKLANLLFARSLARRLTGTGKTANSVHPGVIETNLGRHVPDRVGMYDRLRKIMKTTEQGAATQVLVATHPSAAGISGAYWSDCKVAPTMHAHAEDDALAEALWARTEAIVADVLAG